jgi:prepilin-type N-terminal cleavage/methylation domain-containing protein
MKRKLFSRYTSAFTLIELLITIILIGILSAIIAMSMVNPQKSARDAKRKSDLELIRSGLEIYRADCNVYPLTASFPLPTATTLSGSGVCAGNIYIETVPADSKSDRKYNYVSTDGKTYSLCAALEITPNPAPDPNGPLKDCSSCGTSCNYVVTNP